MKIRPFKELDKDFIVNLATRFMEFELLSWRDQDSFKTAQLRIARESVDNPSAGTEIFVAEDESGELLGFLELAPYRDNLSGIDQGNIVAIAICPESEGKGVGTKLMTKAEEWARQKGYKQIVLNVFSKNYRAVNFYKHLNYEAEVVKMVKEI
ncbi:GNAT family N-acetyltransferase [Shimazuella kribbensis]|uniref:GNAT family N-acetyltransferase n=1 Tax=Shimazuella kribbensis TaxID=139808 RepID=UPI00040C4A1D|nr:GNAT family N-acetyltransferase [Shimazuella kribbensis]